MTAIQRMTHPGRGSANKRVTARVGHVGFLLIFRTEMTPEQRMTHHAKVGRLGHASIISSNEDDVPFNTR